MASEERSLSSPPRTIRAISRPIDGATLDLQLAILVPLQHDAPYIRGAAELIKAEAFGVSPADCIFPPICWGGTRGPPTVCISLSNLLGGRASPQQFVGVAPVMVRTAPHPPPPPAPARLDRGARPPNRPRGS